MQPAKPWTKADAQKKLEELQRQRETPEHRDPKWMHEAWPPRHQVLT